MSLTGPLFLGTLVVITLAAFAAVVLAWPSLGREGVPRVAGWIGMLLGLNGLVLLTAAAQLNAQFIFFADWTDLRGAFGAAPTTTAVSRGITATHAARTLVHGAAAVAGSRLPPLPAGRVSPSGVVTYTVRGARSGLTGTVEVQLPPGYQDPGRAGAAGAGRLTAGRAAQGGGHRVRQRRRRAPAAGDVAGPGRAAVGGPHL